MLNLILALALLSQDYTYYSVDRLHLKNGHSIDGEIILDAPKRIIIRTKAGTVQILVKHILKVLVVAHREGVVHRDLKPENILLVPGNEEGRMVKILDFGVSKIIDLHNENTYRLVLAKP